MHVGALCFGILASMILGLPFCADARSMADLQFDPNCDPKWKSLSPRHTMCIVGDYAPEVPLDQETKDTIVELHNNYRASVDPPAADMAKLIWDDEVAMIAAKWARTCVFGHDDVRLAPSLAAVDIGQNLGKGYGSWKAGIGNWYQEVNFFKYGVGAIVRKAIGHYAQVVQSSTQRIGCGRATCGSYDHYVCNYAPGYPSLEKPYTSSNTSCSACPDKCDASGKLCDCGGKVCRNYGDFNVTTCACNCWRPLYVGDSCNVLKCPAKDDYLCGPDNYFGPSSCSGFFAPYDCPYMCGICAHNCGDKTCYNNGTMDWQTCQCRCKPQFVGDMCQTPKCGDLTCQNGGTVDYKTCTCRCVHGFGGDNCEIVLCEGKQCQNGGTLNTETCKCICSGRVWSGEYCEIKTCEYGEDDKNCGVGRKFTPQQCDVSFAVRNDLCPYMCNTCPHECGDKVCYNGGTMNYKNCSCACYDQFEGETCQNLKCRASDDPNCGNDWMASCLYSYNREHCPYYCGICRKGCTSSQKTCQNGGTLDSTTCTCECPSQFIGDVCQLSVDGLVNVALNKPAKMSSTYADAEASRAVDGNSDTNMFHKSCISTGMESNPWWFVDLGGEFSVEAVLLANRGDRDGYMLSNFQIEVFPKNPELSPSADAKLCSKYRGAMPAGITQTFVCPTPLSGRFVRITQERDRLQFCEVQVMARNQ